MKKNGSFLIAFATMLLAWGLWSCERENVSPGNGPGDGSSTPTTSIGITSDGAIDSYFSVSPNKQVRFSRGNLQYTTTGTHTVQGGTIEKGTWRFAEHQYDAIRSANSNISEDYTGWIDLFGWGTSGWNSGAITYQPYSSDTNPFHFVVGGSENNNLSGNCAYADWGVYNAISNGGDQPGKWRTLSSGEWGYLLESRTDAENKWGLSMVCSVPGAVLLPDNWTLPTGCNFTPGSANHYETNIYDATQWQKMQVAGAVFLPCCGWRAGNASVNAGDWGFYWTSSHATAQEAYDVAVKSHTVFRCYDCRGYGYGVRLVQDVQ